MRHPSAKQRILYVHMHPLFTANQSLSITLNLIDCEDEEACRPLIQRVHWLHTTGREIEHNLLKTVYSLTSRCVRAKSSLLTYILRASPWTPNFHLDNWIVALIFNTWFNDGAQIYLPNHEIIQMFTWCLKRGIIIIATSQRARKHQCTDLKTLPPYYCTHLESAGKYLVQRGEDRWEPLVNSIPLKL